MRGILLVLSDATPGDDDAYNAWYDQVHLADVLSIPGLVAARRFAAVPSVHGELPAREVPRHLRDRCRRPRRGPACAGDGSQGDGDSPTLDRSTAVTYTYRLLTDTGRCVTSTSSSWARARRPV